ncbi:MAG: hypothetical protein V9H25_09620 [Candidatus Competibacter sp.]
MWGSLLIHYDLNIAMLAFGYDQPTTGRLAKFARQWFGKAGDLALEIFDLLNQQRGGWLAQKRAVQRYPGAFATGQMSPTIARTFGVCARKPLSPPGS